MGPDAANEVENTGFLAGKEGLVGGILLEAFRASPPRRAASLGRDPVFLGQRWEVFALELLPFARERERGEKMED